MSVFKEAQPPAWLLAAFFVAAFFAVPWLHEAAHYVVGVLSGGSCTTTLSLDFRLLKTVCSTGGALSIVLARPAFVGGESGSTPTPAPTATPTVTAMPSLEPSFTPIGEASVPAGTGTPAPTELSVTPSVSGGVSASQANAAVMQARALLSQAQSKGVDSSALSEARDLLALAQQALNNGDYAGALRYAEQAESVLNSQLSTIGASSAAGFDWTLAGVAVLILVLAGAYWFYSRRRNKSP